MRRLLAALVAALSVALGAFGQPRECTFRVGRKTYKYSVDISNPAQIVISTSQQRGRNWKPLGQELRLDNPVESALPTKEGDVFGTAVFDGRTFCLFSFWTGDNNYSVMAVEPMDCVVESRTFSGKWVDGRLEGFSDATLAPQSELGDCLDSLIAANPVLKTLSEADYATDKSIEWWLEHNPGAASDARTIAIGTLDPSCSIAGKFRQTDSNNFWKLGSYDVRGYSVVVARNIKTGSYHLVWAEPCCVDRSRDRLIRNVYLESSHSVAMVFYKGKTVLKYHVNLAMKTIRR